MFVGVVSSEIWGWFVTVAKLTNASLNWNQLLSLRCTNLRFCAVRFTVFEGQFAVQY